MVKAINHCGFSGMIKKQMSPYDASEAVMKRAGEIIAGAHNGKPGKAHELPGIELMANSVARHVIDQGASEVAKDVKLDLEELKKLGASQHISSC